jgi:Tfp pilus assembly protein PilF
MKLSSRPAAAPVALAVCACALFACSGGREAEVRQLQARAYYEQGLKSLSDRQVTPGLTSLREAVRLDPDNANYHNALGVVLIDLRRPDEAEGEFRKAIGLDPGYAEAQHNLGLSLAEQGRYDLAIAAYQKALSLPVYATPEVGYYNLGRAYAQVNRPRDAEDSLRTAIKLDPKLVPAYYQLGVVLAGLGRRDEARAAFRQARDLEPTSIFGQAAAEALKTLGEGG